MLMFVLSKNHVTSVCGPHTQKTVRSRELLRGREEWLKTLKRFLPEGKTDVWIDFRPFMP